MPTIQPPNLYRVTWTDSEGFTESEDFPVLDTAKRELARRMLFDADNLQAAGACDAADELDGGVQGTNYCADSFSLLSVTSDGHEFDRTYSLERVTPEPVDLDVGCYVDGHAGQYGGRKSVKLADTYAGTTLLDAWPMGSDGQPLGTYAEGGPWSGLNGTDEQMHAVQVMVDLMDEACDALNAATDGGWWEWEDGEFFLCEPAECAEPGCTNEADPEGDGSRCEAHQLPDVAPGATLLDEVRDAELWAR